MGGTLAPLLRPVLHPHDLHSTTTPKLREGLVSWRPEEDSPASSYRVNPSNTSSSQDLSKPPLSNSSEYFTRLPPIRYWSDSESDTDLSEAGLDRDVASSGNMQTASHHDDSYGSSRSSQPHQPPLQPSRSASRSPTSSHGSAKSPQPQPQSRGSPNNNGRSVPPAYSVQRQMPADSAHPQPGTTESVGQVCSNCGTTRTPLWRRAPDGSTICNACGLYLKARNISRPANLKRPPQTTAVTLAGGKIAAADVDAAVSLFITADQGVPGTCPGDGHCNGTGGSRACSGCPAYNNRVAKAAQMASTLQQQRTQLHQQQQQQRDDQSTTGDSSLPRSEGYGEPSYKQSSQKALQQGQAGSTIPPEYQANNLTNPAIIIACQNCGTTITPLWRRDEVGHTICNACGT
ncbi:hypothetical protein V1506DRAFT_307427 [Lipomyces tetrasporus]